MITIKSLREINFEQFGEETLVLFDLDDTTFIEKLCIMRNINFADRKKFVETIREKKNNERVTFLYDHQPYQLIENDILKILSIDGLHTLGFTARRTGRATADQKCTVEDNTLRILDSLNIKFRSNIIQNIEFKDVNTSNPIYTPSTIDTRLRPFDLPGNAMIKEHVVFCNNIDKGLIMELIHDKFNNFKRFVLIDDKMENLLSMEKGILKSGKYEFIGYHYIASNLLDNNLNSEIIALQEKYLLDEIPQIITDDMAALLLK
jgi:hypothetical protein